MVHITVHSRSKNSLSSSPHSGPRACCFLVSEMAVLKDGEDAETL